MYKNGSSDIRGRKETEEKVRVSETSVTRFQVSYNDFFVARDSIS